MSQAVKKSFTNLDLMEEWQKELKTPCLFRSKQGDVKQTTHDMPWHG